jgi:hypothetical protein
VERVVDLRLVLEQERHKLVHVPALELGRHRTTLSR